MDLLKEGLFGISLSMAGSCLWAGTIFYLIVNKVKGRKRKLNIRNQRNFDEEVFSQLVKQQSEKAFKRISCAIKNERQLLAELIENGELKKARNHLKSKSIVKMTSRPHRANVMSKPFSVNTERDNYGEVVRLAERGMTARKISKMLKIPKGEIEMLITIRKRKRKAARRRAAG